MYAHAFCASICVRVPPSLPPSLQKKKASIDIGGQIIAAVNAAAAAAAAATAAGIRLAVGEVELSGRSIINQSLYTPKELVTVIHVKDLVYLANLQQQQQQQAAVDAEGEQLPREALAAAATTNTATAATQDLQQSPLQQGAAATLRLADELRSIATARFSQPLLYFTDVDLLCRTKREWKSTEECTAQGCTAYVFFSVSASLQSIDAFLRGRRHIHSLHVKCV